MKILDNRKFEQRKVTLDEAASKIKLLGLDIDGVLTDGRICYGCGSDEEIKFFDVKDGSGIKMLMRSGIQVGIISGRKSQANATRAKELGVDFFTEKCLTKHDAMEEILRQRHLDWDECAFVGDDLIDCEVLRDAGIGFLVGDCCESALPYGDLKTEHSGGRGAIREIAEWLLHRQGKWEQVLRHYRIN